MDNICYFLQEYRTGQSHTGKGTENRCTNEGPPEIHQEVNVRGSCFTIKCIYSFYKIDEFLEQKDIKKWNIHPILLVLLCIFQVTYKKNTRTSFPSEDKIYEPLEV